MRRDGRFAGTFQEAGRLDSVRKLGAEVPCGAMQGNKKPAICGPSFSGEAL
jgi:hypothetical protein